MKRIKNKKYLIKIPDNISIFYSNKKKIIIIKGLLTQKLLNLKVEIIISKSKKLIEITNTSFSKISNNEKKKLKALQGTTAALIKQAFIETNTKVYKKLQFIGVGYRAFLSENPEIMLFKLGYSHPIYFKIDNTLKIVCLKLTKLFIFGNSYQNITNNASIIRLKKLPEPYKGKGILYDNEKIVLKEGKKI